MGPADGTLLNTPVSDPKVIATGFGKIAANITAYAWSFTHMDGFAAFARPGVARNGGFSPSANQNDHRINEHSRAHAVRDPCRIDST
jgi:hypothetical protein